MPENTPFSNRLLSSAGINPYEQQQNNKVEKPPYLQTDFNKKLSQNVEPPKSMEDFVADRGMQWLQRSIDRNDMNAQMTPYTYNAGSDSHSFYNKYAVFGQEKMDRIGFSPFKNNEQAFNAQTSFLDRAQRSIVHGFVPLFARGFVSGPKSLARMMQGDFGDDPEDARKYAEAAAIAQDTSGGIGAFFNNTLMNLGYTAGIIGEAVTEELALTALTGGVGGFANLPRFGANIGRAFRGIKGAETLVDMTASLNKSLKSLTNINKAREFFNAGKIGAALETRLGKATTRLANFANPAENLLETGIEIAKNTKQLQGWNRFNNATFKTAGALYRDVRNINMAVSEARLEAGFTRNDTFSTLMKDYQEKHNGALPSESLRKAMMSEAEQASKDTLLANSLLIFASNKVTFNNVMNPKSGLARMMAKKVAEVKKMAGQSTVREFTKKTLASGKELLTPKLTTIKGAWATAKKQGVQKTVKAAIGYTKANLMEGAQEVLQEVISETSKNYHLQSFYSQPVGYYMYKDAERKMMTDKSVGEILGEAFGKQASMQGLETFASGFVMGAFASPLNRAIPFAQESYMRVFKKDEYQAYRDKVDKYVARMTKSVNDTFAKDPLEFLNSRVFSLGTQAELANVIDTGDTKVERDAKEEATIKSVTNLIKMDSLEIWTDYMESLKELTTEEYAEAVGISVEQAQGHIEKLDKVIGRAKEIEKTYKEYNKKFPNPIDLNDYKKGTREYEKASIYHNAWEEGKKNVIFYHENYKNTVERMQKIYQSIGNEELLGKIDPNRVQALLKDDRMLGEIQVLESEVQGLKGMTDPVSKRKLKQTEATLDVLKEYQKNYENFMDHFFEKGMVEPGTEAEKAERLALDKEIEDKLGDSFKNYMKALAKQSDDMILNDNIDIAFNDVLDHYKLGREAGKLAEAVNVLNDPAGFVDHVAKTYDWMYEMWNNREDYIQENISKQLDILKSNQLLNDMADIGVYVDLDEFADYQETGVIPTEFFDAINKRVIKRGSPIYDKVANRFMELSEFKKVIKESKPITKNKNDELAKLDAEEAEEISNLPKVPTRIDIKTLDEKDFSAKLINDELTEGQFIDVTYKEKDVEKTATFFKDQDGILREDNAQGEPVDLESDIKYNNGEIYEIVNRPTDADIAEVRKRYDALRAELLERLNKYGPSASTEAMAKSVEEVKAMLLSDDEYTSTRRNYIIKGKVYERMTNRIKQNHSSFKYTHRSKLENAYDETIGDGPLTEESINAFISKLKSEQPDGFEDYTYTELEEELKSLMEEPLTETTPVADIKVKIADIEKRREEVDNWQLPKKVDPKKQVIVQPRLVAEGNEQKIIDTLNDILDAAFTDPTYRNSINRLNGAQAVKDTSKMYDDERAIFLKTIKDRYYDLLNQELAALEPPSAAEVKIIQTNKPNIQTVGNVTFGTANKQGTTEDNEDAVYVDTQNGIFILADGMGGEYSAFGSSKNFSKDTINFLLTGNFSTSLKKIVDYINSKKGTVKDTSELIEEIENILGYKLSSQSRVKINQLILSIWKKETVSSKGNRLGATALKAKKVGDNTYKIEKVGDTVFFVVDKNGKVIQKHGLSDNASTQGYITYLKDGEAFANSPKIDEFTITLNEGETLVLSTDFIETDKAVQDFIDSDFGKKLNFTEFQKNNKEDDSTFISIKYDAELGTLKQPVNKDLSAKRAEIAELERQKSELLKAQPTKTTSDKTYQDLFNEKWPDASGYLTNPIGEGKFMKETGNFVSGRDIFEIRPIGNGQFEYRIVNNKTSQNKALASYTRYVKPVSEELNAIDGADTIVTVKPGILRKEGDGFIVEKQAQVFYANSSTISNKVGTTTAAPIKVDTTEIDSKIAKAKKELDALEGATPTPAQKVSEPTETKTLRSVQKELDALNDKVDKLNEQIEEADDAGNQTRAENLRMRRQELYDLLKETAERGKEAVPEIKSNLKNYVINYAIENAYETSKANGIYLDNQFKAVFDPKSAGPVFDSKYITQEAYDDLFGENGYITSIKKRADAGEFYVFSTDLIVYTDTAKDADGNPLPPVAGEIDFIFVDREGRKFIVDLKTGQTRKWMEYNKFNSWAYDKKIDNTLQQVGYANLSQRASGEEFQIAIWPVELNYEKTGYINRAGRPSDPTLMLNQKPIGDLNSEPFIINLDKNVQFEIISPEGGRTGNFMTAMDFMEQYVTGPVTPGKKGKVKPKGQAIPQDESSIVDAITNEIQNGNVIKAGMDANMAKTQGTISDASYKYLIGLINQRMNTVLQESAVLAAPGQQFITINDIFAERFDGIISVESKVEAGEIATVESVDEANEEIILVTSNGDRFTVKFSEMNDYIVSPEQLDDKTAPTQPKYEPTQTEIDFTTESMVNVDEFLENSNLRNQATNEADNQSSDEIDNDLFSNLKC